MKSIALLGFLAFLILQLAPAPYEITKPSVDKQLAVNADADVPAPVVKILNRACMDCHSHETRIPWYGRVAPISWLLAKDVTEARQAMNLSEWGSSSAAVRMVRSVAACEAVRGGRMPKPQYVMLHPDARMSPEDVETMCGWSKAALAAMSRQKKEAKERLQDGEAR
jgi:hypothetical protein